MHIPQYLHRLFAAVIVFAVAMNSGPGVRFSGPQETDLDQAQRSKIGVGHESVHFGEDRRDDDNHAGPVCVTRRLWGSHHHGNIADIL